MPFDFENDVLGPASALPDANNGDPVADQFTWEDNPLAHPAAMVPTPDELAGANGTPPTADVPPLHSYQGPKVSVSTTGITDRGLQKSGGLFGAARGRVADYAAGDSARTAENIARSREGYANLAGTQLDEIDAHRRFQEQDRDLTNRVLDFQRSQMELEQQASAQARAEREVYLSAYKEQLAGVRIEALKSGNPYNSMSRGQIIGLAAAQFAQGFLAARGVNIDVAGQVDRWVERSIQEHQQKIQNMRASAEDQLHFYEIARQSSQDDYEARQRYRGFVIAGLQTAIDFNARRFQSDIAMAHSKEQIAKLQIEADATERAIGDAHEARVNQRLQTEIHAAAEQGKLSIESTRAAIDRERLAWEKSADNPKNRPPKGDDSIDIPIADPFDVKRDENGKAISGGKIKWVIDRRAPAGIQTQASDAVGKANRYYGEMGELLNRLEELRPAAEEAMKGPQWVRERSEAYRNYQQVKGYITERAQKEITGAAAPDAQATRIANWLKDNNFLEKGDNAELVGQFREILRTGHQSAMNNTPGIRKVRPGERSPDDEYDIQVTSDPRGAQDYHNARTGGEPVTTPMQQEEALAREGSRDRIPANGAWFDFAKTLSGRDRMMSEDSYTKMPEWAKSMNSFASVMVDPEYRAHAAQIEGDDEKRVWYKAYTSLSNMANDEKLPEDRRKYASYLFYEAEENTDSLHERLRSAPDQRVPLFK